MIDVKRFVDFLRTAGIGCFAGVPDSLLKNFCAYVTDNAGDTTKILRAAMFLQKS